MNTDTSSEADGSRESSVSQEQISYLQLNVCVEKESLDQTIEIKINYDANVSHLKSKINSKFNLNCESADIQMKHYNVKSKRWITIDRENNEKQLSLFISAGDVIDFEPRKRLRSSQQVKVTGKILSCPIIDRPFCGLENIGNTCFMNSALQCLNHVHEYLSYFSNLSSESTALTPLTRSYVEFTKQMVSNQNQPIIPVDIYMQFGKIAPRFTNYRQQDSLEFINILLDTLHDDLTRMNADGGSMISQLFQGEIASVVECLGGCENPLTSYDSFTFLPLPIPPSTYYQEKFALFGCFEEFCETEHIGKHGQWFCDRCNAFTDARKTLKVWKLPQILIIQLKRFDYDLRSYSKINTLVQLQTESLDLNEFVANPDKDKSIRYDLVAVSNHRGSLLGGHYTTYGKNKRTNQWYHYDDKWVDPVNIDTVIHNRDAYVLVYEQQKSTTDL